MVGVGERIRFLISGSDVIQETVTGRMLIPPLARELPRELNLICHKCGEATNFASRRLFRKGRPCSLPCGPCQRYWSSLKWKCACNHFWHQCPAHAVEGYLCPSKRHVSSRKRHRLRVGPSLWHETSASKRRRVCPPWNCSLAPARVSSSDCPSFASNHIMWLRPGKRTGCINSEGSQHKRPRANADTLSSSSARPDDNARDRSTRKLTTCTEEYRRRGTSSSMKRGSATAAKRGILHIGPKLKSKFGL